MKVIELGHIAAPPSVHPRSALRKGLNRSEWLIKARTDECFIQFSQRDRS